MTRNEISIAVDTERLAASLEIVAKHANTCAAELRSLTERPADMCCEGRLDGSHDDDCEVEAASAKRYLRQRLGPAAKQ